MARKSRPVRDIVPLNRGTIDFDIRLIRGTVKKGIHAANFEGDLAKSVKYQRRAMLELSG